MYSEDSRSKQLVRKLCTPRFRMLAAAVALLVRSELDGVLC